MSHSPSEISRALAQLEPGHLPQDIFIQVARLTVTPVIEIVPIVEQGQRFAILLTKRPQNDPIWPGMWHTPGTVIRAYDNSINDGINRLLADELGNSHNRPPEYVGHLLHTVRRGTELALIHWVTVSQDASIGKTFDPSDLPEGLVDSQRDFIAWAVSAYIEAQS